MGNSRTENTAKTIVWGYVGNIVSMLVHFVSRTIFIYTIGVSYLGINGLFTSVLGMLSLTELGIGTAINFNLYKPVANNDRVKIKALMTLYKKAYYVIAVIVAVIGLALLPFLPHIINGAEDIPNISVYYLIFLFNTVSSYFISYKYGLVNAEQKGYIINGISSVFTVITTVAQCVALVLFKNFLVYLLVQAAFQLIQKIAIGIYLRKRYRYLDDVDDKPLRSDEKNEIVKNVKALLLHKLGEISIYQTDNIIISAFVSVIAVGKISNYNLIITSISSFIMIIFNGVTASIGNLIASESKARQKEIFDIYNFLGFWLYGFSTICYYVLFTPFITLWIGDANRIDELSLILIILAQYLTGQRLTVNNMKTAGGIFEQDKYVSLLQGAINLVVSLVCVYFMGLPGVYVGTVLSGLYANIARPIIVYKNLFGEGAKEYFLKSALYLGVTVGLGVLLKLVLTPIVSQLNWLTFALLAVVTVVAVNAGFLLLFFRTAECHGILLRVKNLLKRKRGVAG